MIKATCTSKLRHASNTDFVIVSETAVECCSVRSLLSLLCGTVTVEVEVEEALQCVQLLTEESSGRGSGGDCGCPTGRSVPSMSPPPPGWDETWRSPQILQETEQTARERRGEGEIAETQHILIWCEVILWEKSWKRQNLDGATWWQLECFGLMKCGDKTADSEKRAQTMKDMKRKR